MLRTEAIESINCYFKENGIIDTRTLNEDEQDYLYWKIFLENEPIGNKVARNLIDALRMTKESIIAGVGDRIPVCQSFLKLKPLN